MCSGILWSLCHRLSTSFLNIATRVCHLWSHLPHRQSSSGRIFLGHVVWLVLFFLCCSSRSLHLSVIWLWMHLATPLHCQVLNSLGITFCPSFAEDVLLDLHQMHLFPDKVVPCHCGMLWLHSSWLCFCLCHLHFGMCCSMSICILV